MNTEPLPSTCDVAIVGYGPTGATLANLLVQCGLRVTVLDRESDIYHLPRAVHLDDETMRVFQTVGIAQAFSKCLRVNPGMRFVDANGDLLMDWPRPQEISKHNWHASYRLHQPELEKLLRAKLAQATNAQILTECDVRDIEQQADHVQLTYADRHAQQTRKLNARYVVGCDGANSLVRQKIGTPMRDFGFCERWLVVDLLLKRDMPELGDHSIQFCEPARPMTYCRSPGARRRWEITVLEGETTEDIIRPERVWSFLSRWITPKDADLERSAVYMFQSQVAQSWRRGRLLIAGDAAHLTPPFMGQGMCAGIRDASNLAWKLALCLRGDAPVTVLDSYGDERIPPATEYVQTAMRLGGLINAMDQGRAIEMAQEKQGSAAVLRSIQPRLGAPAAPLFGAPHTKNTGKVFGQPVLSDGTPLDDAIGYAPVVLSLCPQQQHAGGPAVLDATRHPSIGEHLRAFGAHAVLLRPDRFVLSDAQDAEQAAALAATPFPSPTGSPHQKSDTNP